MVIGVNFEEIETPALAGFIVRAGTHPLPGCARGRYTIASVRADQGLPSTFFVNPRGELTASHGGPTGAGAIEGSIARESH